MRNKFLCSFSSPFVMLVSCFSFILTGCNAEEQLLFEEPPLGAVYLVNYSAKQECQLERNQLISRLIDVINKAEQKEISSLRSIFQPDHPFVKEHTQYSGLKVQRNDTQWWYIPINQQDKWIFFFDNGVVTAYEPPDDFEFWPAECH